MSFSSPLFLGLILDMHGPRLTSFLSNLIVAAGLFLFSTSTSFTTYLVANLLIAAGGPGVQNSLIHLGHILPNRRALLTSCITGAFSLR